jgi:hypothetical protein
MEEAAKDTMIVRTVLVLPSLMRRVLLSGLYRTCRIAFGRRLRSDASQALSSAACLRQLVTDIRFSAADFRAKSAGCVKPARRAFLSNREKAHRRLHHWRGYMTEQKEATSLLVQAKTEGLKVRTRDGEGLGHVHALMVDKRTGYTTHAVLSIGGFLGMNKSFYPLPFELLTYDAVEDGYVVTADRRLLEGGPSWANNPPEFNQAYADRVASYYGVASASIT